MRENIRSFLIDPREKDAWWALTRAILIVGRPTGYTGPYRLVFEGKIARIR